jgi:hypothetical protein
MLRQCTTRRVTKFGSNSSAKKVAEGLLSDVGKEVTTTSATPADRLVEQDHFPYRIPYMHSKFKGHSQ